MRGTIAAAVMFRSGCGCSDPSPGRRGRPWDRRHDGGGRAARGVHGPGPRTFVSPNRINLTFALVTTPLLFTGSSQYPWPSLAGIRWFQVVSALNPMTYVSEGLRGMMAPNVPHIQTWICFVAAIASLVVLTGIGMIGFLRRSLG